MSARGSGKASSPILPRDFYRRSTIELASDLIGKTLVRETRTGSLRGRILEAEAYLGVGADPASHAHRGPTGRNSAMFGPPGTAYVYFIYGMHHCLNAVGAPEGCAGAVLIRAVEALDREGLPDLSLRAAGPGLLCRAYEIDRTLDGHDLTLGVGLFLAGAIGFDGSSPGLRAGEEILTTARVGVTKGADARYRFVVRRVAGAGAAKPGVQ